MAAAATGPACLVAAIGACAAFAQSPPHLPVATFSVAQPGAALPPEWQPLTFPKIPRHTQYELVVDANAVVVKASSQSAASGLVRRIAVDPREYPILRWRWKIGGTLAKGDVSRKSGDDYAARLYVIFEFDPDRASFADAVKFRAARALFGTETPFRALNYIWDSRSERDTIVPNAYTNWTMMVVVRSGGADAGQWVVEERNVIDDFRRAFGTDALKISGIAIMTDTDNTGESATAWYGDIVFLKSPSPR